MSLTQARLKELLDYNPETGVFVRKQSRGGKAMRGVAVGNYCGGGYLKVSINRKNEYLHRLAWLTTHGTWPEGVIDHINGVKDDNRLANLRDVTRSVNQHNMPTRTNSPVGCPGVTWSASSCKWRVRLVVESKEVHIGVFSSLTDAIAARHAAKTIYHPTAPTQ